MSKTIFVSFEYGYESAPYPEIDPLMMQASLNQIASMAMGYGCQLVMRDHPVVTAMMNAHFESAPHKLSVVSADSTLESILDNYTPSIAFLLGGRDQVATDSAILLSTRPDITLLPLSHTGGAAKMIAGGMSLDGTTHSLLRQYGSQNLGLTLICKAITGFGGGPRAPGMKP